MTEALEELAYKELEGLETVAVDQVCIGACVGTLGDMPFSARAAQHAAWVAGGDC